MFFFLYIVANPRQDKSFAQISLLDTDKEENTIFGYILKRTDKSFSHDSICSSLFHIFFIAANMWEPHNTKHMESALLRRLNENQMRWCKIKLSKPHKLYDVF